MSLIDLWVLNEISKMCEHYCYRFNKMWTMGTFGEMSIIKIDERVFVVAKYTIKYKSLITPDVQTLITFSLAAIHLSLYIFKVRYYEQDKSGATKRT